MDTMKSVAGSLSIAASVVLIVTLFVGWYVVSASGSNSGTTFNGVETFDLGQTVSVSISCSGFYCPSSTPSNTTTYSAAGLNNTGHLYALMQIVVLIGAIFGIIGGLVLLLTGQNKYRSWATYLILVAVILAIFAPVGLAVLQPTTLSHDNYSRGNGTQASPATSFFGSCSGTSCSNGGGQVNEMGNWGPGLGWYLAIFAFGLFLTSVLLASPRSSRTVASTAPAASGTASAPQVDGSHMSPQLLPQLIACRNCGRVYGVGQFLFCPNCGAKLG